jgi:hypothetical protein
MDKCNKNCKFMFVQICGYVTREFSYVLNVVNAKIDAV